MTDFYEDPEWTFTHEGDDMPSDNRAVAVLAVLKDGSFKADIGRYYGKDGWNLQFWTNSPVVAWCNLPSFKDDTKLVEVEQDQAA